MEKFDIIINQLGRINHEVFFNVVFKMGEGRGGLILTLPRLPLHPSTPSKKLWKEGRDANICTNVTQYKDIQNLLENFELMPVAFNGAIKNLKHR